MRVFALSLLNKWLIISLEYACLSLMDYFKAFFKELWLFEDFEGTIGFGCWKIELEVIRALSRVGRREENIKDLYHCNLTIINIWYNLNNVLTLRERMQLQSRQSNDRPSLCSDGSIDPVIRPVKLWSESTRIKKNLLARDTCDTACYQGWQPHMGRSQSLRDSGRGMDIDCQWSPHSS
jgi:hypothetical protein